MPFFPVTKRFWDLPVDPVAPWMPLSHPWRMPEDPERMRRKSLSAEQIRDPLGTLAVAYGVQRDFSQVVAAIIERLPIEVSSLEWQASFRAVSQLVFVVIRDGRNLGRIYRGSPVAQESRKSLTKMVALNDPPLTAEPFLEMVCSDIRSALGGLAEDAS